MNRNKTLSCCLILLLTAAYFTATHRPAPGYSSDFRDAVGSKEAYRDLTGTIPGETVQPVPVAVPATANLKTVSQSAKLDTRNTDALIGMSEEALAAATPAQKDEILKALISRAARPSQTESGTDPVQAQAGYAIMRVLNSVPGAAGFDRLYYRQDPSALKLALGYGPLKALVEERRTPAMRGDWTGLDRYLDIVTDTSSSGRNRIQFLIDGPEVLTALTEAIEAARSHIHLQFFQYQADTIGWGMAKHLVERMADGVKVRVLLDEHGSDARMNDKVLELLAYLRKNGAEARVHRTPFTVGHLDHRKIIVIDGITGFTGGMNIGEHYQVTWHDQQALIKGPAVARLQEAFLERWQDAEGKASVGKDVYPALKEFPDGVETRVIPHRGDSKDQNLKAMYLRAIGTAERSIKIANPYFVDSDIVRALISAAERGVTVQLVLPQENNVPIVQRASRAFYPDLLKGGVEIYEYLGRMAHLKVAVIDGRWTTFGSSNLDARSFRNNDELNVVVNDAGFARDIETRLFDVDIRNSLQILTYTPTGAELRARKLERWL